jgi:hypothetical protein
MTEKAFLFVMAVLHDAQDKVWGTNPGAHAILCTMECEHFDANFNFIIEEPEGTLDGTPYW